MFGRYFTPPGGGVSSADMASAISSNNATQLAAATSAGSTAGASAAAGASSILSGVYSVDTLPDPAANLDKYAIVTDLFGEKRDKVLAAKTGSLCYWQPVRPGYGATIDVALADMTWLPLKTPSIARINSNLTAGLSRKINLSLIGAWPGAEAEISFSGTLGLGAALNILGTGLGSGVAALLGGSRRFFVDYNAGSLTWRQLP